MIRSTMLLLSVFALAILPGCSQSADDANESTAAETEQVAAAPTPTPAPEPAPAPEPEPEPEPQIELPEGLPKIIHIHPEMTVTEANTLNAEELQFEIKGETRKSVVQVLNYYTKYFRDNGWEEDMIMEHEGNTVVSFSKDGVLQYVDSTEGGYGCYITITTGKY